MADIAMVDEVTEPDFERMLRDPAVAFDDPMNVVYRRGMRTQDKTLILRRWEHMVRSRGAVAAGEVMLMRIRDAIRRLEHDTGLRERQII